MALSGTSDMFKVQVNAPEKHARNTRTTLYMRRIIHANLPLPLAGQTTKFKPLEVRLQENALLQCPSSYRSVPVF